MRPLYRIVFFSSLSILAFEITLVRIFSITFAYHYASLIISVSMAGLVLGGVATYLIKNKADRGLNSLFTFSLLAFGLCISYPVVFILSTVIPLDPYRMLWENVQVGYLFIFILLFSVPFFLYGMILSLSFSVYPQFTGRIYASDLVGAALGVALAIYMLNHVGIELVVVLCSMTLALLLLFSPSGRQINILCAVTALLFNILIVNGTFSLGMSSYKGLMQALREDGSALIQTINTSHSRLDLFESPTMKQAAGLSLAYSKPIPQGFGMAIDGDIAGVIFESERLSDFKFFPYLSSALPYLISKPTDVLVVGFRNSQDVLMPYYFGAKKVYKAEMDLSAFEFISRHYEGGSLNRKLLYRTSGRMLAAHMKDPLGVIFISKSGFSPASTFGLREDYDTTVEALRLYLSRLKGEGILFIQMFILPPPRYELRMFNNIIAALGTQRTEEVAKRLLVYRSWDTMNFLVKNSPFTGDESRAVRAFLTAREFDVVFPQAGTGTGFISGVDYKQLFSRLLDGGKNRYFIDDYPFDIRTTTDDRPFFHYFLKLGKVPAVYEMTGRKWAYFLYEGMALPFILVFLIIISLLILSATFLFARFHNSKPETRNPKLQFGISLPALFYFVAIGFGFMLVEVFFIHKLVLPLDSPVSSFSATLVTLLTSSGCGSLLAGRMDGKKPIYYGMAAAPLLLLAYLLFFGLVVQFQYSFISIIPAGVLFGLFFPSGIKLLCKDSNVIPFVYAVNGAASIVAPILASVTAAAYGCNTLLVVSALLYAAAFLVIVKREASFVKRF